MASTAIRATIVAHIARDTNYDASTVVLHRDGTVSAILDADKTYNGPHTTRILLGSVAALLEDAADRAAA